jgi:ankyrin repeat domain-containing protein 50
MPFKSLSSLVRREKGKDADRDKAPAKPSSSGQPVNPPSGSATQERSETYGLFFLNQQQFEDVTKAGEARSSVDIVALHGLHGDAYRTWTHQNGRLWLRDFLAQQLPGSRVFTFGYPSEVTFTLATGQLGEFARSLLEELNYVRRTAEVRQHHPG